MTTGPGEGRRGRPRVRFSSPHFPVPADAGLQPERTSLAWTRTSCSLVVVGLLGLRWAGALGGSLLLVAVLGCAAMLLLLAVTGRRSRRLGGALHSPTQTMSAPLAPVLALLAVVLALGITCAVVVALA